MKTVLKVGAGLFVLLFGAAAVFYFLKLKEPEPGPVCEHIVPIMKEKAFTQDKCIDKLVVSDLAKGRTQLQMANYRKCLLEATSSKDINACK